MWKLVLLPIQYQLNTTFSSFSIKKTKWRVATEDLQLFINRRWCIIVNNKQKYFSLNIFVRRYKNNIFKICFLLHFAGRLFDSQQISTENTIPIHHSIVTTKHWQTIVNHSRWTKRFLKWSFNFRYFVFLTEFFFKYRKEKKIYRNIYSV